MIREAQLTAAFRSPAVEWSLTDFLTVLDTDLASAAMLAATRVVDELPPAETTKALMVVATDQWRKVNVLTPGYRQLRQNRCLYFPFLKFLFCLKFLEHSSPKFFTRFIYNVSRSNVKYSFCTCNTLLIESVGRSGVGCQN